MKKYLFIILGILFFPQVSFGATLYSNTTIGTSFDTAVLSNGIYSAPSRVSGTYYGTEFYITNGTEDVVQIYRISGNSCAQIATSGFTLGKINGGTYTQLTGGTSIGNVCQFSINPADIVSGVHLSHIGIVNQNSNGGSSVVLDGNVSGSYYNNSAVFQGSGGLAFQICSSSCSGAFFPSNTATRIDSTTPDASSGIYANFGGGTTTLNSLGGSTYFSATSTPLATSTTMGAIGYVSAYDWATGTVLRMKFMNVSQLLSSVGSDFVIDLPITSSGVFNVSTTTVFSLIGQYSGDFSIVVPDSCIFGIFFCSGGGIPYAYPTIWFVISNYTQFDFNTKGLVRLIAGLTGQASTTSDLTIPNACGFASFNLGTCALGLVIPDAQATGRLWTKAKDGFLSAFPFGYANRFVSIATGQASSTVALPSISYTFGSSSPAILQGKVYNFALFTDTNMNKLATIYTDQGDNKNLWDIVDPVFYAFVWFLVVSVILMDTLGLEFGERVDDAQRYSSDVRYSKFKANVKASDMSRIIKSRIALQNKVNNLPRRKNPLIDGGGRYAPEGGAFKSRK